MARGLRRFPARGGAPKRRSSWVGSADQGVVAVAGNASVILQSNATLIDTTIVRTRGILDVRPSTTGTSQQVLGAFGMLIVSDQAFAAGAGSVPGPWTDQDADWFVWEAISYLWEVTTDVGRLLGPVRHIDSKAMRKVNQNETVVVVYESQATAVNVGSPFRMLVKLP